MWSTHFRLLQSSVLMKYEIVELVCPLSVLFGFSIVMAISFEIEEQNVVSKHLTFVCKEVLLAHAWKLVVNTKLCMYKKEAHRIMKIQNLRP